MKTSIGPVLAITSWRTLLEDIDGELTEEPDAKNDLLQLHALCCAADNDAFVPISPEELTNQRIPGFVMQMTSIQQTVVDWAITEGILNTHGLTAENTWKQFGRYVLFPTGIQFGAWFGVNYELWKRYGVSPLWLVFSPSDWGHGQEAHELLQPWCRREKMFMTMEDGTLCVALDPPAGEGKDQVIRSIQNRFVAMSGIFSGGGTSRE